MTAPPRPDPDRLREGEAGLAREMEALQSRVGEHFRRLDEALAKEVTGPVAQALDSARDAHLRLLEGAGLDRPTEEGEPRPWPVLRAYREEVAREVVAPLLDALDQAVPGERVGELWSDFLSRLQESAGPLPAEIRRPEPEDLYHRLPADGAWKRFVKRWVRGWRGVTGVFSRGRVRQQRVPLLTLGRGALRPEALPGMVDLHERLQLHYAEPLAGLERALGRWLRDWFPREDEAHAPEGHLSVESAAQLERIRKAVAPVLAELGLGGNGAPTEDLDVTEPGPGEEAEPPAGADPTLGEGPIPTPGRVARGLQEALDSVSGLSRAESALEQVRTALDTALARLAEDVRTTGSILERTPPRSEEKRLSRLREHLHRRRDRWGSWHTAMRARLVLTREVLDLRGQLDRSLDRLLNEVLEASVFHLWTHLGRGRDGLLELVRQAGEPRSGLHRSEDRKAVADAMLDLEEAAEEVLAGSVGQSLDQERMEGRVRAAADRAAEEIADRLRGLPESLEVHPLRETVPTVDPAQPTRPVRLQEVLRQSLDVLHLESLRTAPTKLLLALEEARSECRELPKVVEYNLNAARNELLSDEEQSDEAVLTDARTLAIQGLERTARAMDQVVAESLGPWGRFAEQAHGVLHRALVQAHDRLTLERAVQEQFADIRSLLEAEFRRIREAALALWGRARVFSRHAWKHGEVRLRRLIRRGRVALGTEPAKTGEVERAMEVLRGIPALLEPLPLVYRRLFSFQPVTDPSLLVGREDETLWVSRRWDSWREGLRAPSLLTGPLTVGHTSFFNVVAATVFKDAKVVRLNFPQRYRTETALAERIAQEFLNAGVMEQEAEGWTLDRLARFLLEPPAPEPNAQPLVVLVEQLPHLILRVPGGMDLAERFLEFQARTSPAVFWLSSASESMWKLLKKTQPRAAALVTVGEMSAIDRPEMEKLITARHQRSGVPLEFLAPDDANPLLRRKLQRARNEEERYEILKGEFFDRLYRASQGNVPMAILLWLKSADFSTQEGWLQLSPPRSIRFSFLEELDLGLDFALMALLEHGSLTLEEYATVFAVPGDEAFQAFEALRTRSLLDRLESQGSLPEPVERVQDGIRYRIPPLLSQVVSQYLRNHNILH